MPNRTDINTKILINEYLNGKSTIELAKQFKCTPSLIQSRLKKSKIKLRDSKGYKSKTPNLINKKFGKLKVINRNKNPRKSTAVFWDCKCSCGNLHTVRTTTLLNGTSKQCTNCAHPKKGYKDIPNILWKSIINGAKQRGLEFKITIEDAYKLYIKQNKRCSLTNLELNMAKNQAEHLMYKTTTASLDRIDSSKGYIKNNIQWIHKDVNLMKYKFNQDYFIKICSLIYKNQSSG